MHRCKILNTSLLFHCQQFPEYFSTRLLRWTLFCNYPNVHSLRISHPCHKNFACDFFPLNWLNETRNHLVVRIQTFQALKLLICVIACLQNSIEKLVRDFYRRQTFWAELLARYGRSIYSDHRNFHYIELSDVVFEILTAGWKHWYLILWFLIAFLGNIH